MHSTHIQTVCVIQCTEPNGTMKTPASPSGFYSIGFSKMYLVLFGSKLVLFGYIWFHLVLSWFHLVLFDSISIYQTVLSAYSLLLRANNTKFHTMITHNHTSAHTQYLEMIIVLCTHTTHTQQTFFCRCTFTDLLPSCSKNTINVFIIGFFFSLSLSVYWQLIT